MMDLLLISRCPPFPLYHGDRLIPYHIARQLTSRRYQIDLLAFYQNPADLAEVPRYERYFRSVTLVKEPERSIKSYWQRNRKSDLRFPQHRSGSWSPEMWDTIEKALKNRVYDVTHVFGGVHVYEFYHLIKNLPNLIVPYESYSLWLERDVQEEHHRMQRWYKQLQYRMACNFESWMFENYDRVVVLTDHDARTFKKLNPRTPTIVIPNGVDTEYFAATGYEPDEPTLLFTGNYDYAPNLDAAMRLVHEIFPRVKQAVPSARLCLVGGNPPPALRACASDDIEIPGRVPDLRPYFEMSMVYISPLRLGAGIKNKILEAMAMQKPIVATPLSCDGIPVMQSQHVLLGISDEDLAKCAIQLLKTPSLRQTLIQNGLQLIEQRFTWAKVVDLYEDLYMQVIREHKERAQFGLT
jgi:glycosyltransferase involved in cell wall biosynthesis